MPKSGTSDNKLTLNIPAPAEVPLPEAGKSPVSSPLPVPGNSSGVTTRSGANTMSEMDINILFKFIKPYDGNRETLNSFITNCNNAMEYATPTQKPILFKYMLSQLTGRAEVACSIKEFSNWEQLKEFLKVQFCQRKHYAHLLTELQESRQGPQEGVTAYALRVETLLSQLLTEITLSTSKAKEVSGRTASMEDLALHHFLMGLFPRISNIVRCRSPKNLNEAISLAVSEERIQQTMYKRQQNEQKPSNNSRLNNNNNRFNNNSNRFNNNNRPARPQNTAIPGTSQGPKNPGQGSSGLYCRYCKFPGHDISECKKREYNNNRFKTQPNHSPRVNYLEGEQLLSQENYPDQFSSRDEVDSEDPSPLNE